MVRFLLSAGADPTLRISKSPLEFRDDSVVGLNAYELAAKLEAENPAKCEPFWAVLTKGVR
jgi:hypothetical protein